MLWSITENFEDLRHFPSGSQVHSETGHGTPCGQADYTRAVKGEQKEKGRITAMLGQIFISLLQNVAQPTSKSVSPFESSTTCSVLYIF